MSTIPALKMCGKKVRYPDRESAARAARVMRRRGTRLHPYRCLVCPHWHIGHPPRSVRQSHRDKMRRGKR